MKNIFIFFVALLVHAGLHAQVIEQLSPQEKKQLTRVTEPITLYKGFLRSGMSINYFAYDSFFDQNGDKLNYESNITSLGFNINLSVIYGITDRLEVEAVLPYNMAKTTGIYTFDLPPDGVQTQKSVVTNQGIGDMITALRYQVVAEKERRPAITLGLGAFLPTGTKEASDYVDDVNYKAATGRGELTMFSEFRIRKVRYPFSYEFSAGMLTFFGTDKIINPAEPRVHVKSGTEMFFRPQVSFHLNEWISLTHAVDYYSALKDEVDGDETGPYNTEYNQWVTRYSPAFTMQVKRLRLEQVVQIPIAGKGWSGDPNFYFNVQYMF